MGIFPEINRVWVTIDNRLYLWNYEAPNGENALNTFDDQEQIIVTVGLVKPLPGVFLDEIEYILVVTTPLEIILLGMAFTGGKAKDTKSSQPRGPLTLYRTDLTLASDGVNFVQVVGTDEGRVFMLGSDNNVHELAYQAEEGWFSRKIRKLNHSASALTQVIVPPFLKWFTEGGLFSICVT
jgi:nuclear pore complex protein Nup155